MFNIKKFSDILQRISNSYNSITDFSDKSEVNRTYLSKYINMKLNNPPTPKILEKIASASNGLVSYGVLMEVCGYLDVLSDFSEDNILKQKTDYLFEKKEELYSIGLSKQQFLELQNIINMDFWSKEYQKALDVFLASLPNEIAYKVLIFMQNMIYHLRIDAEEKIKLVNEIKKEIDISIENAQSPKDLSILVNNFTNTKEKITMLPLYGEISAGLPNWAEECIEGRLPIDPDLMGIVNPEEHYFLRVNGESMNKIIKNGAFALIHKQDYVNNGEIAVVLVNGFDATLKKFSKKGDIVVLTPESNDASFKQQIYTKDTPIQVIGKYIGKMEINK